MEIFVVADKDGGMGDVEEYLVQLSDPNRAALQRVYDIASEVAGGEVEEGMSYGMAAYRYRGKGLVSALETAKHFGVYPHSSRVVADVVATFGGESHSTGALRFPFNQDIPEDVIRFAMERRVAEIDAQLEGKKKS